jgi:hypothetical protein
MKDLAHMAMALVRLAMRRVRRNSGKKGKPKMKKPLRLIMATALAATITLTGCKTTEQTRQLAVATKMAAYVGTSEYLRVHPEARPKFEAAERELFSLESAETLDAITLLAIAQRLPVKELKSERAAIYITAATILLSEYGESVPIEQLKSLQPVAKAMREGISLGLGANQDQ